MIDTPQAPAPQTVNADERLVKARAALHSGAQPSAKSVDELLANARLDRPEPEIAKIRQRLRDMPQTFRRTYLQAVAGRSKAAAIKAFCAECVAWERREVTLCTAPACPLYAFRPFTKEARP